MMNIIYLLLAAFGLGFLIFIHELGHYFMARRVGMTVEAFAIGFGKPLFTWNFQGVKWHICCLPFGGYVKIKGMEKQEGIDLYSVSDGYFGKKPIDRIKVALMGPIVNIIFAFIAFSLIWSLGGRSKPFSEFTKIIGWVDPQSELFEKGVKPGDEITRYDGHDFQGYKDLMYAAVMGGKKETISGFEVNYSSQEKTPFTYTVEAYPDPRAADPGIRTFGILSPASYLIYEGDLPDGSPMMGSGIQVGDRIVSVDGSLVFSIDQLQNSVNDSKALLTVKRGENTFLTRIPRVAISDLRLGGKEKAELDDWKTEAKIEQKIDDVIFIPYKVNSFGIVEGQLSYIGADSIERRHRQNGTEIPLHIGDQILAVDGKVINSGYDLTRQLQNREVQIIVERSENFGPLSWKDADRQFDKKINWQDYHALLLSIGNPESQRNKGNLFLLNPVVPKTFQEFSLTNEKKAMFDQYIAKQKEAIDAIEDPVKKEAALVALEKNQNRSMLGIPLQDRKVIYNPSPFALFYSVLEETGRTMKGLVTGNLNPKWMSGPVGIVQVMHHGWSLGFQEAIYWMALISLNLGILNLLPIPVLDGGHICFALYEQTTKRRLKAKTIERLIIPFVILLVGFLIFVTYQDLARLISRFF